MTSKKKANELINAFAPYCTYDSEGLVTPVAKQCALIAVKEILNIEGNYLIERTYWQQVKAEIEKL